MSKSNSVIKLSRSVLVDPFCVALAAIEIKCCASNREKVVAVVSALSGETDRLLAAVADVDPHRVAEFVTTGEVQSACLLRIALEPLSVTAKVIAPSDCGLLANGKPLDANPIDLDVDEIHRLLENADVTVTPGFAACDDLGRSVPLGRGDSDDTALFLAQQLGAKCRLIKDVDGIFEFDPARSGPPPRRFRKITWRDGIRLAGVLDGQPYLTTNSQVVEIQR